ncbi:Predicted transcriptional regulator, ArsR family [Nonomuraea solani]|uniref:Predicted transcriptional regulator, ArsR family n=1 Tax=Nonomuraea solani TaxID=1144553 RepID=A0A1H6EB30_9ACTN|nr:helix-turn-helix domain-containing protein [Nonomuraea solani]SEG94279.1 Predicted transcriptional regulator, ArsR family [Nonomuraea solani]
MRGFEQNITGIGALAEPVRLELYLFVCAQPGPVSRDQAAEAIGIARHKAKFHLDKMEAEGLLEAVYARLSGRKGPGAGRSSKLYRRAAREFAVSLPSREYLLAGRLMSDAIAESARTGEPVMEALYRVAAEHGATMGEAAIAAEGRPGDPGAALDLAVGALEEHGYEPRALGDRTIMANCPFHALAEAQTELVCHMNHALISGLVERLAPPKLEARLEPGDNRCCVSLALP